MIRRVFVSLAAALTAAASIGISPAAEITTSRAGDTDFIEIAGPIEAGDEDAFERAAQNVGQQYSQMVGVLLDSPGGNILPALAIGESIRHKGFTTGVLENSECASACGLIWLAGTRRFLAGSAKVGFHAAYTESGDTQQENGPANALIGAYLTKLGLSYTAVAYITEASPTSMNWLHPSEAQLAGIELVLLPGKPEQTAPPAAPPPAPPADNSPEARAKALVASYYGLWSASGTNVEGLAQYYGDTAIFYGASERRDRIMDVKRKFSVRWPTRHYEVQPGSMFAQCIDSCAVTGVVRWDVSSQQRGATSTGTANFVLRIALNDSPAGGVILSEDGAVLSARAGTMPTVQASLSASAADPTPSPAYAAGRQARLDYEAWFSGLTSDYRDGAAFWAENRSLEEPPSCMQPGKSPEWQSGCNAGRARLALPDARRHSEADFKAGWNSL